MTAGTLLQRFTADEDLALLLAEPELAFLKNAAHDAELSLEDLHNVSSLCERVTAATERDLASLAEHETCLLGLIGS